MLNTNRNLQIGYKKIQIKLSKLKLDGIMARHSLSCLEKLLDYISYIIKHEAL